MKYAYVFIIYLKLSIIIISIFQNPTIADIYTEHSCPVNVAKYSPSGFYIASGGNMNENKFMTNFFFHCLHPNL